ncbi:hypothetical protein PDIG_35880 [Penicillium digitatum PHI26]|uniref:Uncharacterized protein n=2 Tax=Penicillium digitatum TaxID=36651 RepID=K9FXM7_PEND2|nr:hypothetical protein PDIP_05590 [Penicillium digitatum Pd1]EKV13844.1 hypothetical protein PDIG_35880 [Penicillium digitatum PHI26]EKV21515.1 hypothetical protein PDIP_05590 [Penicillium digitatum Pd1]
MIQTSLQDKKEVLSVVKAEIDFGISFFRSLPRTHHQRVWAIPVIFSSSTKTPSDDSFYLLSDRSPGWKSRTNRSIYTPSQS